MGYFATLSDAQQWTQRMRTRYPNAVATPAPLAHVQPSSSDVPAIQPQATATTAAVPDSPSVADDHLSDSRLMRILENREAAAPENSTDEHNPASRVEVLRPEDTQTRRSLKQAIVEGVAVPFAVQLEWSLQPINASRVPRLAVFEGYTLYRTEKRRGERSCYFLRLGFFTDAMSAKAVACRVRSIFASAAVVPVTEQEFLHADEARIDTADPAGPFHDSIEEVPQSYRLPAEDFRPGSHMDRAESHAQAKTAPGRSARAPRETLEDTLNMLAQRELWTQPDLLSDSGVRHLTVMIEQRPAKSSQKRKPPARLS